MSNDRPSIKADEIPEDLRSLIRIVTGLELVNRVIDEGLFTGDSTEAVAQARQFVREQHKAVLASAQDHPDASMIFIPQEDPQETVDNG